MNNDLISREDLKEVINSNIEQATKVGILVDADYLWQLLNYAIENAPTVTPIDETFSTAIDKYGDNTFSVSVISSKGEKIGFKRVKRGKWIKEDKPFGNDFVLVNTCSICGESFIYHGKNANYCSNCGAEMEEAKNE